MDRRSGAGQPRTAHEDQLGRHQPRGNLVLLPDDARELQAGEGNPGHHARLARPDRGEVGHQTALQHLAQGGVDLHRLGQQDVGRREFREPALRQNTRNRSRGTQHARAVVPDEHGLEDVAEC